MTRIRGESGIYHVLLRGVSRQSIFEDDEDRRMFIGRMKSLIRDFPIEMHAYCLMDNHIHLLLRAEINVLSEFVKRLASSYAMYFNKKYDRVGHLFQGRFKSEPTKDDPQYLVTLRYILKNPQKAGIASMRDYIWSSYRACVVGGNRFAEELVGGRDALVRFLDEESDDSCLDVKNAASQSDSALRDLVKELSGLKSASMLGSLERERRDEVVARLLCEGASERRIERVTGISRGVVRGIARRRC